MTFEVVNHKRDLHTERCGVKNRQHGFGPKRLFRDRDKDNIAKNETQVYFKEKRQACIRTGALVRYVNGYTRQRDIQTLA